MTAPTRYISVDDLVLPDHSPESIQKACVAFAEAKKLVEAGRHDGSISEFHLDALDSILRDATLASENKDYLTLYAASQMILLWKQGYQLNEFLHASTTVH